MIEREKKFLIAPAAKWAVMKYCKFKTPIVQSYIVNTPEEEIRVRVCGDSAGLHKAELTQKTGSGEERTENTESISLFIGLRIVRALPAIVKKRYIFNKWEIDLFDSHSSLIIAEHELEPGETLPPLPDWLEMYVAREVTLEENFKNKNLIRTCGPFLW